MSIAADLIYHLSQKMTVCRIFIAIGIILQYNYESVIIIKKYLREEGRINVQCMFYWVYNGLDKDIIGKMEYLKYIIWE